MTFFNLYIGKIVQIEVIGDKEKIGYLIDVGPDIIVIYKEKKYFYIPTAHIKNMKLHSEDTSSMTDTPPDPNMQPVEITYLLILNSAIGRFVEIYVSDKQTIHGYVKHISQDYFVFYSLLYKVMYIPLVHLKWISPYQVHQTPYSLIQDQETAVSSEPSFTSLPSTFEHLLQTLEGEIVCLDSGLTANKIGLLQKMDPPFFEIITADEKKIHYNMQHIKNCIHFIK